MIYIQIDNTEYDVISLAKTTRLNGIDSCKIKIGENTKDLLTKIKLRKTIKIFSDDIILFEGFGEDLITGINEVQFTIKGKLSWLDKRNLPYEIQFTNYDLLTFLNKNPAGIIFEDYNLETYQKTFSIKFSLQSYFQALVQLSQTLGFKFWYDYSFDRCFLGTPNKTISISDDDILAGKVAMSSSVKIETSKMANYLQVYGGGIDKLTLGSASTELQNLLGFSVVEQENPYDVASKQTFVLQDDTSVQTYGILADSIIASSVDATNLTNEGKTNASDLLLILASTELRARKDPIIELENFIYSLDSGENFSNANIFEINAHINPNNLESDLIDSSFFITDINYIFDKTSTEGNYICTLASNLPTSSRQNTLLQNLSRSISRSSDGLSNKVLNFVTSIGGDKEAIINFSLDTSYKKISTYEMYLVFTPVNAIPSDFVNAKIFLDNFEITNLFAENLGFIGTEAKRFPESLNADILNNSILNSNQISTILNNLDKNKHTIQILNDGSSVLCNIEVAIIIQAEI
jgi:hypothetical protein